MLNLLISLLVALDLCFPKVYPRFGHYKIFTPLMTMPKASIDENACAVSSKDNIRFSWQSWMIQSIPKPHIPQILAHNKLRLCVFRANGRHYLVSLFYGEVVWHDLFNLNARIAQFPQIRSLAWDKILSAPYFKVVLRILFSENRSKDQVFTIRIRTKELPFRYPTYRDMVDIR